jgi:membrane-anchored glycerophosphoryl diester phosphodiesterase (GDPDase)
LTILVAEGSLQWVALTFTAAFIENFVFFYLSAGLIICVSQIPLGNSITIREGLSQAWYHKRPIAGWTIIGALLWISVGYYAIGFYLITVFALPAIVLDNKDLIAAIRESIFIFRRMWVETYVSFGIILLITIGFVLVTLFSLGQVAFAYGLINGGIIAGMISLVMCVLMAIGLVIMGITTFFLYKYEKAGVPLNR